MQASTATQNTQLTERLISWLWYCLRTTVESGPDCSNSHNTKIWAVHGIIIVACRAKTTTQVMVVKAACMNQALCELSGQHLVHYRFVCWCTTPETSTIISRWLTYQLSNLVTTCDRQTVRCSHTHAAGTRCDCRTDRIVSAPASVLHDFSTSYILQKQQHHTGVY